MTSNENIERIQAENAALKAQVKALKDHIISLAEKNVVHKLPDTLTGLAVLDGYEGALQGLVDQAQELDMGYGKAADHSEQHLEKVEEKPWIEWGGGECPLQDDEQLADIKYRDGRINKNVKFLCHDLFWLHFNILGDIIAYRLS